MDELVDDAAVTLVAIAIPVARTAASSLPF